MRVKNNLSSYVVEDYFFGDKPTEQLLASRPLRPEAYEDPTDVIRE